jgi:hypothetical protein
MVPTPLEQLQDTNPVELTDASVQALKSENELVPVLALLRLALGIRGGREGYLRALLGACNQKCPGISDSFVSYTFKRYAKSCDAAGPVTACKILRCLPYDDPAVLKRSCICLAHCMTKNESDAEHAFASSEFVEPSPPQPQSRRAFLEEDTAAIHNAMARHAAAQQIAGASPEDQHILEQVRREVLDAVKPRGWDAQRLLEEHHFHTRDEAFALAPQYGHYLRDACDAIMPRPSTREQAFGSESREVRLWDRKKHAVVIEVAYNNLKMTDFFARVAPDRAAASHLSSECTRLADRAHAHSRQLERLANQLRRVEAQLAEARLTDDAESLHGIGW